MKRFASCLATSLALFALLPAWADETNGAPSSVAFDAGALHRMRHEASHNIPGNPGGGPDVNRRVERIKDTHLMRFDTFVWARADAGPFTLYTRLANSMREYFRTNGQRRNDRAWTSPDEIILDNLYLAGHGLFDGFLDFRFGRQDLSEGGKSTFGLDRILFDGTPADYSRTYYADMARITLHPADDAALDLFGIYDSDANPIGWGRQAVHERSLNRLTLADDYGADQWGGGAVWRANVPGGSLPYAAYVVHKRDSAYRRKDVHVPEKELTTIGALLEPRLADDLSLELEGAGQTGRRKDWGAAGGWMGVGGFDWHPTLLEGRKTSFKLTGICYTGDKDRGDGHGDSAWDPLWARYTGDSEIFSRGGHPQIVYWSNMLFVKATASLTLGPRHSVILFSGPIWSMADDGVGGGDGNFKGVLSRARYNFPILLRPKNARGIKRFEVYGNLVCEAFHPGSYYESSKPALYARWQLEFRF